MMWISGLIILWLGVCAVQDLLRRQVSNWLTIPPFAAAGVWAVWRGGATLLLFGLVSLVMVFSFWKGGTGGADGKILATLAVFLPTGFLLVVVLRLVVGVWLWMRHGRTAHFPAVPVFAAGAVLSIILQGGF
jgi:prepilin peptidase CpaA